MKFKVGDTVEKIKGDYVNRGIVVSVFKKRDGKIRVVVEEPDEILSIFPEDDLELSL